MFKYNIRIFIYISFFIVSYYRIIIIIVIIVISVIATSTKRTFKSLVDTSTNTQDRENLCLPFFYSSANDISFLFRVT